MLASVALPALACLAVLSAGVRAWAGAYTYGTQTRVINAAYLVLPSAHEDVIGVPDPYVFYILNNRNDLRPNNWSLTNPMSPKVVTTALAKRFQSYTVGSVTYPGLTIGEPVTPAMAAFWEIDIGDLSTTNVSQFDVLVIHIDGLTYNLSSGSFTCDTLNLSSYSRRCLRQFLDKGGTLIIDGGSGTAVDSGNSVVSGHQGMWAATGMFADVQWYNGLGKTGIAETQVNGQRHPLLTVPYYLSQQEINQLGANNVGNYFLASGRGASNQTIPTTALNPPDESIFETVVGNSADGGLPYIAAGDYGGGHIIVTAANICNDISNPVVPAVGQIPPIFCNTSDFSAAHAEDLKFMVNAISYSSTCAQGEGFIPRHTSSSESEFGGSLLPTWEFPPTTPTSPTNYPLVWNSANWYSTTTPAIFANIAFITDGQGFLHAFDVYPTEDLDGNGNADDYAASPTTDPLVQERSDKDLSQGRVYDQLWTYLIDSGGVSSPTVAILPQNNTKSGYTWVIAEGSDGSVYGVPACVAGGGAQKLYTASGNKFTVSTPPVPPPAPTVYHGRIFAIQPDNSLAVIDLAHPVQKTAGGTSDPITSNYFKMQLPVPSNTTWGPPYYAPMVASIPSSDGTYGGDDIVVTVSCQNCTVSLLVGSLDETIQPSSTASTATMANTTYATKSITAKYNGVMAVAAPEDRSNDSYNMDQWVYISDPNYSVGGSSTGIATNGYAVFSGITESTSASSAGITITSTDTTVTPANVSSFYADYDLSSNSTTAVTSGLPTRMQLIPSVMSGTSTAYLSGSPAESLGNQTVYTANAGLVPYIAGLVDQNPGIGAGSSGIAGPYMRWRFALVGGNGTGDTSKALTDGDGIQYAFAGFAFVGSPIIGPDGFVYALAYNANYIPQYNSDGTLNSAGTVIPTTIVMCFNPNARVSATVPSSSGSSQPTTVQQYVDNNYVNGVSPGSSGANTLSPPQVPVNFTGGTFTIRRFDNPLNADASVVQPDIGFPMPLQATTASVASNGYANSKTTLVIKLHSVSNNVPMLYWWAKVPNAYPVSGNTLILSPMTMVGDWLYFGAQYGNTGAYYIFSVCGRKISLGVGMNGTTREINESGNTAYFNYFPSQVGQILSPLVSAGRYAVAQGGLGIEGFGDMLTLVSDRDRLIAFNPDGSAEWSCDSTYQANSQGGASSTATQTTSKLSLNRPSTLSQLSASDYLTADTGNNRCVRLDQAGQATWELTTFSDPYLLMPAGQSNALAKPTSCITWSTVNSTNTQLTNHYLVSDTGNYRVLEVDDTYTISSTTATQSIDVTNPYAYHTLVWESHTLEQGRKYQYVAAQVYQGADSSYYIMAAVANKRIAPIVLPTGQSNYQLQPPASDAEGSSIVLLYYGGPNVYWGYSDAITGDCPTRAGTVANSTTILGGTIAYRYLSTASNNQSIQYLLPLITYKTYNAGSIVMPPTPLRGVRFLVDYYRYPATFATQRTMFCDDDGVFDGIPAAMTAGTNPPALVTSGNQFVWYLNAYDEYVSPNLSSDPYGLSFTEYDYDGTVASYTVTASNNQPQMPYRSTMFRPASALLLANQDYLITNQASSGDPGSADTVSVGGNVFEVYRSTSPTSPPQHAWDLIRVWGLPTNSAPLVQPAFAMRPL